MPELPDLAGFKQYLDATSLHQAIRRSRVHDERIVHDLTPRQLYPRLNDRSIESSRRIGKFLFASLSGGGHLVLHFGMTGELDYRRADTDEPPCTQFALEFDGGHRLHYICRRMLGQVNFTDDPDAFAAEQGLGPDALSEDLTLGRFRDIFSGRRGMIKPALMDQGHVAGLGNVYSDEVLFQAGIHPAAPAADLDDEQIKTLYRTMRRVMKVCQRHGGDASKMPSGYLLPRREPGAPCPRCDGELAQKAVSGRKAVFCPSCQPKP
jgi:formamidopyrimidine-DNA glycosylase